MNEEVDCLFAAIIHKGKLLVSEKVESLFCEEMWV